MDVFTRVLAILGFFLLTVAPANAGQQSSSFGATLRIVKYGEAPRSQTSQLRYTCQAASYVLLNAGYRDPVAISCSGDTYSFNARRLGTEVQLDVKAASGKIIKR